MESSSFCGHFYLVHSITNDVDGYLYVVLIPRLHSMYVCVMLKTCLLFITLIIYFDRLCPWYDDSSSFANLLIKVAWKKNITTTHNRFYEELTGEDNWLLKVVFLILRTHFEKFRTAYDDWTTLEEVHCLVQLKLHALCPRWTTSSMSLTQFFEHKLQA